MGLDKLAKILHVDEVNLLHGPRGVAVHVRIEKSWHSATIDNDDLEGRRLEAIAEHLAHLADSHINKSRDRIRKSELAAMAEAEAAARSRAERQRMFWRDADDKFDGVQRQVRRAEPEPTPAPPPSAPLPGPAVSEPMPSRIHAIMQELREL